MSDEKRKLNLGGGRDVRPGWDHLDSKATIEWLIEEGCDPFEAGLAYADLDDPEGVKLPYDDDTYDLVEASHVLEHITHLLPLVQEVHRITKPGGQFCVAVPYGSSDDAFEDPTHVRQFFPGSWSYFSQPIYWRGDYGYRGDFKPVLCLLYIDQLRYPAGDAQAAQVMEDVITKRNTVHEMRVVFDCIKPIRDWTDKGGMDTWETRVVFADLSLNQPDAARQKRIEEVRPDLWTP